MRTLLLVVALLSAVALAGDVCSNPHQQHLLVGTSPATITTQTGGSYGWGSRTSIRICNSDKQSAGGAPNIAVTINGAAPVIAADGGTVGAVLTKGTCDTYKIDRSIPVKTVSDAANTEVEVLECE